MVKTQFVLDASAVLAFLQQEKGAKKLRDAISQGACISAVNMSEVLTKSVKEGLNAGEVSSLLTGIGLTVIPFDNQDARLAAEIYPKTKSLDLSLEDRACLSLGMKLGIPILTTNRSWLKLNLKITIEVLR